VEPTVCGLEQPLSLGARIGPGVSRKALSPLHSQWTFNPVVPGCWRPAGAVSPHRQRVVDGRRSPASTTNRRRRRSRVPGGPPLASAPPHLECSHDFAALLARSGCALQGSLRQVARGVTSEPADGSTPPPPIRPAARAMSRCFSPCSNPARLTIFILNPVQNENAAA